MNRRRKESGFALLMVFLMAACVAIMLYLEMPRVAFEAERQKELLLIDRGNQFKRAISVFVRDRKNNPTGRYPATIDELENFNNVRYLRRRYVDPMTGKDEWRLIHTSGVPGVFPDSVTMQSQNQNQDKSKGTGSTAGDYITQLQGFDAASNQQQGGASAVMRRRPSEAVGAAGSLEPGPPAAGGPPGDTGGAGSPGAAGGASPAGSNTAGGSGTTAAPAQPCTVYIGGCAPASTGAQPGAGAGAPGQTGNQSGGVPGGSPGMPGQQQGGQMSSTAQSAAAGMIQDLLTKPRPGGMPTSNPGTIVGGGIAGVASKYEAEGIMSVNKHTAINEWEFIFDLTKYVPPVNPLGGGPGMPANAGQGGAAQGGAGGMGLAPGTGATSGTTTTGGGRGQ